MKQVTIQNPEEILSLLADVALRGSGFVTECLRIMCWTKAYRTDLSQCQRRRRRCLFRDNRLPGPCIRFANGSAC